MAPLVVERGFRSFLDLYYLLKYDDASGDQGWRQVLDALSVPETYFWREIDQIRAVVNRVVPELVRRSQRPIRIWSAPCATGEEPLTIAMALNEAGWFDRVSIEINGSDGSPAAVARAQAGRYRPRAMRTLPATLKEKYFVADGDTFIPRPELARRISSWSVVNLMQPEEIAPFAQPDPFLRRVIFFPQDQRAALSPRMPVPGLLCVGASDPC